MRADLHVHSTASDGVCTPSELVSIALARGLTHLSIADHDSVEGVAEALAAASGTSLTVIPAVELSSTADDGTDVHILGYFVDVDDEGLAGRLRSLRDGRLERATTILARLSEAGLALSLDEVMAITGEGAVGRSHIARALVAAGHSPSVADAFERLIGRGRPFYVAKDTCDPVAAMATIREAGGFPVIAHPGVSDLEPLTRRLTDAGLAGIEAYHAEHTPDQRETYRGIADEYGLFTTGGSDFHGIHTGCALLGSVDYPVEALTAFLEATASD